MTQGTETWADRSGSWSRARTPAARRVLTVVWILAVALVIALSVVGNPTGVVIGIALLVGSIALLRLSVASMADIPEELVDERIVAVRNRAYWLAYVIVSTAVALTGLAAWIAADAAATRWQPGPDQLQAFFWGVTGLTAGLPSAILAWTETEI